MGGFVAYTCAHAWGLIIDNYLLSYMTCHVIRIGNWNFYFGFIFIYLINEDKFCLYFILQFGC